MQELMTMLGDLLGRKFSATAAEIEALRAQVADLQAQLDTLRAQVTLNQTNITFPGTVQRSLTLGDDGLLRKKKGRHGGTASRPPTPARKDGLPTVQGRTVSRPSTHTQDKFNQRGRSADRPHTHKHAP